MRLALVNGMSVDAEPDLQGLCRVCGKPVTARCGEMRIWHWAHKGKKDCDEWWEPETEWHRSWKNKFPKEWQEVIRYDQLSGKHIADLRTEHGLVIEFQHSAIKPEERKAREAFYGDMVWVVDGTRLKHDYPRFCKRKNNFIWADDTGRILHVENPENCLPLAWLNCSVPVIFDFRALASPDDIIKDSRNLLYCLFPGRIARKAVLAALSDTAFIKSTTNGEWSLRVRAYMAEIHRQNEEERLKLEKFRLQSHLVDWHMGRLPGALEQ